MTTQRTPAPSRTPAPERGLLGDVLGTRPASTLSRELFALVVNAAIVTVVILVLQPPVVPAVAISVVVGLWLVARLIWGFLSEGYRRTTGAGR